MTLTFAAPGQWAPHRSHHPGGSISQWLIGGSMAAGTERVGAELGAARPLHHTRSRQRVTRVRPTPTDAGRPLAG